MELTGRNIREQARMYPDRVTDYAEEVRQLDILPVAFAEGSWTQADIEWLVRWKSQRVLPMFQDNDADRVAAVIAAVRKHNSPTQKVQALTDLRGVGVPMASAFLLFMNPTAYTVIDRFAWQALTAAGHLEQALSEPPTVAEYLRYLGVCHSLATELEVDLRTLDRGLWVLGKED